jgi:hypothetical protein
MPTEVPGNYNTAALFAAATKAVGDWQINVPRFKGYSGTGQAIGTGTTFVSVTLDSEYLDTEGGHSTVTNTSRYTCQVAGWYWTWGTMNFPTSATGNRSLQLAVNGTGYPGSTVLLAAPSGNSWIGVTGGLVQLAVNDYLELQAWQTSGGSLTTTVISGIQPTLSAVWVSS